MKPIDIARVCHEVVRAYGFAVNDLRWPILPTWQEAPQWMRDSALSGVMFLLQSPDAGPGASHGNWMSDRLEGGWVYGPLKDVEKRTHPDLVPFGDLPKAEQAKDHLFVAIVRSLEPLLVKDAPPPDEHAST